MSLFAFAAAVALSGAAGAYQQGTGPEWVRVNGDERVTAYVDRRSIRTGNGSVRFNGRIVYAEPDEEGIKELLHSGEINCARRDYRIIHFDAVDAAGNVVATHVSDDPATAINDGSPNAALHAEYCR